MGEGIEERFEGYKLEIDFPEESDSYELSDVLVEVRLITRDGQVYSANVVTPRYLAWVIQKNKETEERGKVPYFCMPRNMIIMGDDYSREDFEVVINDLIKRSEIEAY